MDEDGHHVVAYFSKEKETPYDYNLACILTLPPYQRKGYGKLMIALSYELSNREGKKGSPEKPLSDMGQISYKSYWSKTLINVLRKMGRQTSIEELSDMTGFQTQDIIWALQNLQLIRYYKGEYQLSVTQKQLDDLWTAQTKRLGDKGTEIQFYPQNLQWEPSVTVTPNGRGSHR